MKNVQIPQELFMKLLRYHLLDDDSCTEEVKNGLEQKMNAMVERELYTRSKTAPAEEEREKARQEKDCSVPSLVRKHVKSEIHP